MDNTVILIPSHLRATRLPNKPLLLINDKPMIVHCWQRAVESKVGDVYVATADEEIAKIITAVGGKSILTSKEHKTGTDRIYEAIENNFSKKPKNIINLQGDMPNIDPLAIKLLDKLYETLKKFISLKRSNNEIARSLEQMRAMDNNISLIVGLTDSYPLGVDTIEDLEEIRNIMKNG